MKNAPKTEAHACPECDLLLEIGPLPPGTRATCPRCNHLLAHHVPQLPQRLLAFSSTALVLFALATAFPFLSFQSGGQIQRISLIQSVTELWFHGYAPLSALLFVFIILAPLLFIVGIVYLLLPLSFNHRPPLARPLCRLLFAFSSWSMAEVFLFGVLVSLYKIAAMATVIPGISFWAYIAFCLAMTILMIHADRTQLWHWVERGSCA